jgi:hypothetical protein
LCRSTLREVVVPILGNCIRRPLHPIARTYRPAGGMKHRVRDADSWQSVAKAHGMNAWELIRYNFPGLPASEREASLLVNWYLQEHVGCRKLTSDSKNYCFSAAATPGEIWVPGRMNTSINHAVPVLRQPQTWACWYTSLQMVVQYWRGRGLKSWLVDPSEDAETQALYLSNTGISERERLARKLGFTVQYASMSNEGMWDLLKWGPVIYAGAWPGQLSGHWVVIVGISDTELAINNPAAGQQTWDYDFFMNQYLLQTAERPLVYAP